MTSVRTRILLFFTLFAAASLLAVFVSSRSTRIIGVAANDMVGQHLPMVTALEEMEVAVARQDNAAYRYLVTGDKVWLDECEKERANYNQRFSDAARLANQQIELDKLTDIDELYVQYDNQTRQVLLTSRRDHERAMRMLPANDQFLNKI